MHVAVQPYVMQLRALLAVIPFLLVACASENESEQQARSTFAFTPDKVDAWRSPAHAECGETGVPFSDDDLFDLRPQDTHAFAKVSALALSFKRTTPKDLALEIHPQGDAAFDSREHVLLQVGVPDGAPRKKLTKASVTFGDMPTKDGESLSARVTIEFADGDVLAETIAAPVVSGFGSCPTGG